MNNKPLLGYVFPLLFGLYVLLAYRLADLLWPVP